VPATFQLPPPPPIVQQADASGQLIRDLQSEVEMLRKYQQLEANAQLKIKELAMEIERMSRLYDFEISKHTATQEKLDTVKLEYHKLSEEKQLELAKLKYEYRKIQENLVNENSTLKHRLQAQSSQNVSPTTPLLNVNGSSPRSRLLNASGAPAATPSPRNLNIQYHQQVNVTSTGKNDSKLYFACF